MLACILFVFGALVEYAAILFRRQTGVDDHRDPVRKKEYTVYFSFSRQQKTTTLLLKVSLH